MEANDAPSDAAAHALVVPTVRALLDSVVDYAGLFPPADLDLATALHNYASYRTENESWMLSRFVLPARRLPDLRPHQRLFKEGDPYAFSVLGTGGDTADAFRDAFRDDLDVIETFHEEHRGRAQADVMEVPLPSPLVEASMRDVLRFLDRVYQQLVTTGTAKLDLFLEVPVAGATVDLLAPLCAAIAERNSQQRVPARSTLGLKMRCGGLEPADIPDPASAAAFIVACRDAGVPFKATAGLHHPVRHYDDTMETDMHGFLNLFGAAVLAAEHDLSVADVQLILQEDLDDAFRFTKDAFAWRDLKASMDDIMHARETLATSFGSCSFEEPVDDLRDLDLI